MNLWMTCYQLFHLSIRVTNIHLNMICSLLLKADCKKKAIGDIKLSISEILISKSISHKRLAELSGLSSTTVSTACKGERISTESAQKIADALKIPVNQLFNLHTETTGLSSKTILHHHRLISSILAPAARDRLVPINIADKNYMKAPKLERKEADFLDDEQVKHVLELLDKEPIK